MKSAGYSVGRDPGDSAGKIPDLPAALSVDAPRPPMDLPRAVMRGALGVVIVSLLLALLLGLWRARSDMREELSGALTLASSSAVLASATLLSDDELIEVLARAQSGMGARHLALRLVDARGRARLEPAPSNAAPGWLEALVALNAVLFAPPQDQTIVAALPRPLGPPWQVQWVASHDYEQREALAQLAETMLLLAGCSVLMLWVMRWRMLRAFRPLKSLLAAIARVERQDLAAVRDLPTMPVRELDVIAGALRHLGGALQLAESQRRQLAAQVQTLQEDERSRLARELHDELGQHLTALRVDAAWLQRRLAAQPELAAVVQGMSEQCERVQAEVRALLTRLRPLGPGQGPSGASGGEAAPAPETVERLRTLLDGLVRAWAQSPGQLTRYSLRFEIDGLPHDAALPRDLVLAVYRISQEALTNVARHAQAQTAQLSVRVQGRAGGQGQLHWSVEDDGRGLDAPSAWQRGNGLAGIKERVWAAGGDLGVEPRRRAPLDAAAGDSPASASDAGAGSAPGAGLRLHACLPFAVPGAAGPDPHPTLGPAAPTDVRPEAQSAA